MSSRSCCQGHAKVAATIRDRSIWRSCRIDSLDAGTNLDRIADHDAASVEILVPMQPEGLPIDDGASLADEPQPSLWIRRHFPEVDLDLDLVGDAAEAERPGDPELSIRSIDVRALERGYRTSSDVEEGFGNDPRVTPRVARRDTGEMTQISTFDSRCCLG